MHEWLVRGWNGLLRAKHAAVARWTRGRSARRRTWAWITGLVLFLAALVTVLASGPGEVSTAWDSVFSGEASGDAWAGVVVEQPPVLTNGEAQRAELGMRMNWVRSTMPQVDFTVRNEGDSRVVLGRARIDVLASDRIVTCEPPQGAEGGIPVAESIFVNLPLLPLLDERVVYHPLHREIPPHHTTRIKLYFRSLDSEFADDLFALDVSLLGTEPGQQEKIGRYVIGVPSAIPRYSSVVPESVKSLRTAASLHALLPSTWCFRRNLATVRRYLAMQGRRSPSMHALTYVHPPRGWSQMADQRSAAEAAKPLLHAGDFFLGPALAVFAAERSGSKPLLATVRREAIAELHRSIERDLAGEPPVLPRSAVVDARTLLTLTDSDQARSMLSRSEAALRQSENVLDELSS